MYNSELILFLSSIIYLLRICFFLIGFLKEYNRTKNVRESNNYPFISIIIPARNEETNIEETLLSLNNIDYPQDRYEIIVVNDRSTDNTRQKVEGLINQIPNLKLLNLSSDEDKDHIPGKAGAVHKGVEYSKGDIIFVTDADCRVRKNWLKKLANLYQDTQTGFVTSFTNVLGERIFDKIQATEWIYMHTMAMGGIGMSQPLGCYGNNLTFRKQNYNAFGGYKTIPFSVTEDLALQKAFHKNSYGVHYYISYETLVDTKPCKNIIEYFNQHHRWARGGLNLGWRAAIFVLSSFSFWAGLIYFAIIGNIWNLFILFLIRLLGDFILLYPSLSILKRKDLLPYIFISVPFFLLVELTIPIAVLKKKVEWKNQVFEST